MWYAGKEFIRGKHLYDYLGKNEKIKVVIKISKAGMGAPSREPLLDKGTHAKVMAQIAQKEEEKKKMEQEGEEAFIDSAWAKPVDLKKEVHGVANIKWK